jgi:hypothetical protein
MLNVGRSLMSIIGYWILKNSGIRQNSLYPIDLKQNRAEKKVKLLTVPRKLKGENNDKIYREITFKRKFDRR